MNSINSHLEKLVEENIVICIGPGGVGKTTVTAMLGVFAAKKGEKVLCATIDPSERLSQVLGIPISNQSGILKNNREEENYNFKKKDRLLAEATTIESRTIKIQEKLDLLVLHGAWVIDHAMQKYIPEYKWEDILKNPIYIYMRNTLRGLHELAGMDMIYELKNMKRWDTIIVDTAPANHGIDFIEMPQKIQKAIRSPLLGILGGWNIESMIGNKVLIKGKNLLYRSIGKMVGLPFLEELSNFIAFNRESLENICLSCEKIRDDILNGSVKIVQVTSPSPQSLGESITLHQKILTEGLSTNAFIINRVMPSWRKNSNRKVHLKNKALEEKLLKNVKQMERIYESENLQIKKLKKMTANVPLYFKIPLVDEDVYKIETLSRLLSLIEII